MANEDTARAIEAATNQLYAAQVGGDAETYGQLLSDEFVYVHSTGDRDSKTSVLEKVGSGAYGRVAKIDYTPAEIWVLDDVVVALGTVAPTLRAEGSTPPRPVSSADVWHHVDGRWQLLVHHLTKTPQAG
jgi:ketosteroid isomerase-like protein